MLESVSLIDSFSLIKLINFFKKFHWIFFFLQVAYGIEKKSEANI